jgi:MoaA/NifB/PqqE/SkfB family radical SAM enzyme
MFQKLGKILAAIKKSGGRDSAQESAIDYLEEYNRSRSINKPVHLCHAPFNNMYFNSLGHVANCWLTFHDPEIYTPDKTIMEIWNGEKFSKLRNAIKKNDLSYRCNTCKKNLENKNFVNVLAKAYDNNYPLSDYPSIMEFELDNTCNLECTMCTGLLSSSIRKNRDKLPPLKSPYGDKFVQELREFIPHLHEARFNGGEPFLIKTYFKIWDAILEINPGVKITIATNGTVLNERVKDYLQRGNFHINISIDGLTKETYNNIRVNGDIDAVINNFLYFKSFCRQNNRTLCVMINPMRQNWWEMPDFVNFCNEHGVHLWFNTIERPLDQALWNLPVAELEKIYHTLSEVKLNPYISHNRGVYDYNIRTYKNLVHTQILNWLQDARLRKMEVEKSGDSEDKLIIDTTHLKLMQYMKGEGYSEQEINNLIDKLDLLLKSFEEPGQRRTVLHFLAAMSEDVIVMNLKGAPFEELKQRIKEYLP